MPKLLAGRNQMVEALTYQRGIYSGDNLLAMNRNLSFLADDPFMAAFHKHTSRAANAIHERGGIWRYSTLTWAARRGMTLEGDFVECACYKGTSARITADVVDFAASDKRWYLYDMFEHDASMPHHVMPEHGETLFEQVKARFADTPNVTVIKGMVPDSLAVSPEKTAFMHIDLNNAEAEVGALELLWDRMSPGAVLILDDFGFLQYRAQNIAERAWFEARGYSVLEIPTGQGIVIK
jgi:O-methyltransferase